jgi:enamine deaminase RidA (YjgF/YER057c/UK114 family)
VTTPSPEARLAALGIDLPAPVAPVASYVPVVVHGGLAWVSGQLPFQDKRLLASGTVPSQVSTEAAAAAARQCVVNALAALRAELGSLSRVERVVRVGVFVASDAGYGDQPKVANGASDLLVEVFGEAGRHARAAVGCPSLPRGTAVEVELLVAVTG